MTPPPKSEEAQILEARLHRAARLMEEDADLRLLRDEFFPGQADDLNRETLKTILGPLSLDSSADAKGCALAATKIRAIRDRLVSMAAEKPESPKQTAS